MDWTLTATDRPRQNITACGYTSATSLAGANPRVGDDQLDLGAQNKTSKVFLMYFLLISPLLTSFFLFLFRLQTLSMYNNDAHRPPHPNGIQEFLA